METLPVEMVERIVQQLTPQDLARCSAVCREWREIFNQDWMWKPHCDPELEEPLRTIPCVATPAFVAPEVENSTLSPISYWKLAFMRENHLWNNWRSKEMMDKNEHVTKFDNEGLKDVDFLKDTLVVVWYSNHIEIVDVSIVPTALVAKTEIADCNEDNYYRSHLVIGSTMLLVEKPCSIQVLNVDISNGTIELKHTIPLTHYSLVLDTSVVKEHLYIFFYYEGPKHQIFDLNTGELLKEELSPVRLSQNERLYFGKTEISPTSDFVAFGYDVKDTSNGTDYRKYYIYSDKQLAFLPGPVANFEDPYNDFALLGHWIAATGDKALQVHNFKTGDVILSHAISELCLRVKIKACNDCFVVLESNVVWTWAKLYVYFPSNKSFTTLCEVSNLNIFSIINNKFIELYHDESSVSVWKPSDQAVEKCDFAVRFGHKTNRSFTKVLNKNSLNRKLTFDINYLW